MAGLLNSVRDGHWGATDFGYDPAERLLHAIRGGGVNERFDYDPAGNLARVRTEGQPPIDQVFRHGPGSRLSQRGDTLYQYDDDGRLIKKTEANGGDPPRVWLFSWDAMDRLPPGPAAGRLRLAVQIRCVRTPHRETRPGASTRFLWDREVIVQEIVGEEKASAWIYDIESFVPLAKVQGDRLYSVVCDQLGTPRELVDTQGRVVWGAEYTAWGAIARQYGQDPEVECPIRFQGQWFDEELGLHYNWYRYYDPQTGSFLSQDPVGFAGGINPYLYAKNPINWVDPFGLIRVTCTNQGRGYSVYMILDKNGRPAYIGIVASHRYFARIAEHQKTKRLQQGMEIHEIDWAKTYGEARGYEQAYMIAGGTRETGARGLSYQQNPANRQLSYDPSRLNLPRSSTSYKRAAVFNQAYNQKAAELGI